jgi:molecular chaperone GrpE (heat shock protein)
MNEVSIWKMPKWPFVTGYILFLLTAAAIVYTAERPISEMYVFAIIACVTAGTVVGCFPFFLDYRAVCKMVEVNAVSSVADQLHDLKTYSAQIAAATERWALVQEATKGNAEKTTTAAREIAEKMAGEIREFNEFQVKLNDTEKGALRLEVEKLRRTEGEWLQVVARILDHIFALHNAASRSGNVELSEQIANFQNACRDAARRVGLTPLAAAQGEKFDAQKHRVHGVENPPADGAVAETLAPGLSFQGRLLRPVLVKLHDPTSPAAEASPEKSEQAETDQLALEAD